MKNQRLVAGTTFVWQKQRWVVVSELPNAYVQIRLEQSSFVQVVNRLDLVKAFFAHELTFEEQTSISKPNQVAIRELSDYRPQQIEQAQRRLAWIQPLLTQTMTRQAVKAYAASLPERVGVSSLYRWRALYLEADGDLRALIAQERAYPASTVHLQIEAMIQAYLSAWLNRPAQQRSPRRLSAKSVHQAIVVQIAEWNATHEEKDQLKAPSERTIARRIAQLDPIDTYTAIYGKAAARRKYQQYGQMDYPTVPLERVEMDHTTLDVIVVDEQDSLPLGRPTLTTVFDTATRYPIGIYIGFEPPSYYAVKAAMYQAILPKPDVRHLYLTDNHWEPYGLFDKLVVDNGKEFTGQDLHDVCQTLGIKLEHTPVKMPHFKAGVERVFRTYNAELIHQLPGTTLSNPQERGDYDSVVQAAMTLSDLKRAFYTYVVDIYAQEYHKGLSAVPSQRWQQAIEQGFQPRLFMDADELYVLFGRVTTRVLQHYGIELMNLRYNQVGSNALSQLRSRLNGQAVKVKYHPDDLSRIHIYDPFNQRYLEVPALDQTYTSGLSLWKHRVILKEARLQDGQVDALALGRARQRINEIVNESRTRHQATRRKMARWQTGEPVSTPDPAPQVATTAEAGVEATADETQMSRLNRLIAEAPNQGFSLGPSLLDLKAPRP